MDKEPKSHSLNVTPIRSQMLKLISLRFHEPLRLALDYRRNCDRKHDSLRLPTYMHATHYASVKTYCWTALSWLLHAGPCEKSLQVTEYFQLGASSYYSGSGQVKRGTARKQLKSGSRLPEGNREEARRQTSERVERKRHRKSVAAQEVTGKCWTGIKHERNGLP